MTTLPRNPHDIPDVIVVLGLGIYGRSVCTALRRRDHTVIAIDDRPSDETRAFALSAGVDLRYVDTRDAWDETLDVADWFMPSPGVPEWHLAFEAAHDLNVPIRSEFDLVDRLDDRPRAVITGTDGKTTVTLLATSMLNASGRAAIAVGNTETPIIDVIDDPQWDAFVIEASSFRLAHTGSMPVTSAAWLNFAPDHLDVHRDLETYEAAKAKAFEMVAPGGRVVLVGGESTVERHVPQDRTALRVGLADSVDGGVVDGTLYIDGHELVSVDELPRAFDHDITNTLIAAAIALDLGATVAGVRKAITDQDLLPHRMELVAESGDIRWWNDSKATVPHAVITAVRAVDSVVLIAGGKNKGLDLGEIADARSSIRSVIAIGDSAPELVKALGPLVHRTAASMGEAVSLASEVARPGDNVVLSPGCASFDWYSSYGERGDDFRTEVHRLLEATT